MAKSFLSYEDKISFMKSDRSLVRENKYKDRNYIVSCMFYVIRWFNDSKKKNQVLKNGSSLVNYYMFLISHNM